VQIGAVLGAAIGFLARAPAHQRVVLVAGAAAAGIAANAPNVEEATALLEFLVSETAQEQFANANNEYPVLSGVAMNEHVAKLGIFIPDSTTPTSAFSENAAQAQAIFNEVGWN
jgi:iron(III) transport system substrate-binding protein